jgi:hypothetical protein
VVVWRSDEPQEVIHMSGPDEDEDEQEDGEDIRMQM